MNKIFQQIKNFLRKTPLIKIVRYFYAVFQRDFIPATLQSPLLRDTNLMEAIHENLLYLKFAPPGHYYSPIPASAELRANQDRIFNRGKQVLPGIDLDDRFMLEHAEYFNKFSSEFPFPEQETAPLRFWTNNKIYSKADAWILYSMIRYLQPSRIIEVGSGMSSCLMLDVNELFLQKSMHLTFIDPHPDRLLSLIRPTDMSSIELIPKRLQDIDLDIFQELEPNDIAFFDSTHVSKCDSDVNKIFFKILPVLKPGVFVHFHDVFYPFEYPKDWLLEIGAAWNELYVLRAFLEFNNCFQIAFFNDYMGIFYRDQLASKIPGFLDVLGSSIWLKKTCSS